MWQLASPDRLAPGLRVGLAGGGDVLLRPFHPGDEPAVHEFLEALSPDSRRLRFFAPVPVVRAHLARDLVQVDQARHLAWGAFAGDRCVAEARAVVLTREPTVAEVAFAVADDQRRRGLGWRMLELLGLVAAVRGVLEFEASVLPDNRPSRLLLSSSGMRFQFADGVSVGRMPVPSWSGSPADARRALALQCQAEAASLASVA
jgi:GNAT superfamily N-acetyltransferase